MINQSLRCPSCGQNGFIVATGAADLEEFVATICHYCGHLLDKERLVECLARNETQHDKPHPTGMFRPPRRSPRRR
jgi:hypothetical protein